MSANPNNRPTWLQYLANELIAWREHRNLTQEELAAKINYSPSMVSMVETAQRQPKPEFIQACDNVMDTSGALLRLYKELVIRESVPDFVNRWRGIEESASGLNTFQLSFMPGMLQTQEYARAVLRLGLPTASDEEIDTRTLARIERKKILTGNKPPMYVAILDEGVIRRVMKSVAIMREQVEHLIEMCELSHVRVQIVPDEVGGYAGFGGPFTLATLDGEEIAFLDTTLSGHVVEDPGHVAMIRNRWESLRAEALSRSASLKLMKDVATQWTL
ncbi:helix-turn-helix domain-containing protein [Actinomadura atramentaria]|uniref:helix-turn-helix domain-containing protein n=1 Tax=Actinomadura atramentaria TaxID=1990 RepID=UPI0003716CCA|nr:helix-turn-helix transcriptional regulator [Actinomadura atramentaria]